MGTRSKSGTNRVRIIAGRWRGRRVQFPDRAQIRPTPDRVRETIFNWVRAEVEGAACLDLFAGSAILSFECLSRGAKSAIAVEKDRSACQAIRRNAAFLGAADLLVVNSDVLRYLTRPRPASAEIVFIDPPYNSGCLPRVCGLLEQRGWLASRALIYVESRSGDPRTTVPSNWVATHEKLAGQVAYRLFRRVANGSFD